MNIFTIFCLQNCSKIYSKTHQIARFLNIFSGEHAPEPPLLQKLFEPPPPPPPIIKSQIRHCITGYTIS